MSGPRRYSAKQVIDALNESKGLVSYAARRLGCSQQTIESYCDRFPSIQEAKKNARTELVDLAEVKLWQHVNTGNLGAVFFVLRTLGRDRGYGEKVEVTGKDGGPVQHAHIHVWQERLQAAHNALEASRAIEVEATPIDPTHLNRWEGADASDLDPA